MKAHALIPIFYVADIDAAEGYYTQVMGFVRAFRYGTYVGLRFGSCELHITDPGEARQIAGAGTVYMICDEVDELFETMRSKGARLKSEPEDRAYGMRDFAVLDLDGNQVSFGCDSEQA